MRITRLSQMQLAFAMTFSTDVAQCGERMTADYVLGWNKLLANQEVAVSGVEPSLVNRSLGGTLAFGAPLEQAIAPRRMADPRAATNLNLTLVRATTESPAHQAGGTNQAADHGAAPLGEDIGSALTAALSGIPSTMPSGSTPVVVRISPSGYYTVNRKWEYANPRKVVLESGWGVNYGGSLGFSGLKYHIYKGHDDTSISGRTSDTSRFFDHGRSSWLTGSGWDQTTSRQSHLLDYANGDANQSGSTESAFGVYALVPDLSSVVQEAESGSRSFEKDAIRGLVRTEAGFAAQAVGVLGRCDMATPTNNARKQPSRGACWGLNGVSNILPGSDGYSVALELNNINHGSEVKTPGGYDKIGLKLVPGFSGGSITAGIYLQGNGQRGYYNGIYADQASLVDDPISRFIKLPSMFEVLRDGTVLVGKSWISSAGFANGIELLPSGNVRLANYSSPVTLVLDGNDTQQRIISFQGHGVGRFNVGTAFDGTSDLVFNALTNGGDFSSTPLRIKRADGSLVIGSLTGTSNRYVCASPAGALYASATSCR